MSDRPEPLEHPRSSRQRYQAFVQDYKRGHLDDAADGRSGDSAKAADGTVPSKPTEPGRGKRRAYLREYLRRLRSHRYAVGAIVLFALTVAGLEMIEPLFLRFIVDRVLLDTGLDQTSRIVQLNLAGAAFLAVVLLSRLTGAAKDYRQKLLNVRVMLSLRRALYDRLLHLPLPALWDMKTGGILSRLSGDIDTTTGLL